MHEQSIIFSLFLIFIGAALMATLALLARQALIIAYIVLGVLLGPAVLAWVNDTTLIQDIANIGIIFLLFLLGMNLTPQKLFDLFRQTALVTALSATVFALVGFGIAIAFGFSLADASIAGVACMFSSTIIALKLLPTTVLHHRHTGEVIISVLLLQDLIAIVVMLVLQGLDQESGSIQPLLWLIVKFPVLIIVAVVVERYLLMALFKRYDRIQEYIFLVTLAWCLGIAQLAHSLGFSYEIGAFIAGVVIASNPIATFIAESLKPLRDFFLVLFFFALGAGINVAVIPTILFPALVLGGTMIVLKPVVFRYALKSVAENDRLAWETGWRLGQMSEFSLLLIFVALSASVVSEQMAYMIQLATIITFIGSSYCVVLRYPTPVAVSQRLRRD
ncbi:MAG: cation:proton antiporter [Arenicella sp.]